MADIRHIRSRLGLSQEELALMIGVSQTLLSLTENGLRDLPSRAHTKLRLMEEQLQENEMEEEEYLSMEKSKDREQQRKKIEKEIKSLRSKRDICVHQLNLMRMDHQVHHNALLNLVPEVKLFKFLQGYSEELQKKYEPLVKKYIATDESHQRGLESKIRIINSNIAELEDLLAALKNQSS